MKRTLLALLAGVALLASVPAKADQTIVVQACGTLSPQYVPGVQGRAVTIDINGNQCSANPANAGGYPGSATPIQGNGTGSTGAVVGTLAGAAAKTTYLCDFDVSAIGGTAAVGPITVAGLLGGSKVYQLSSSAAGVNFSKSFNPCLPASAVNTAITITTTADGTATAVDVNSSGYQQ
jgi:hypothetical protein